MDPRDQSALFLGAQTLKTHRIRTLLSSLGVVIGVGALLAILNLGDSLERYAREQVDRTTALGLVEVSTQASEQVEGLSVARQDPLVLRDADGEALRAELQGAAQVALLIRGTQWVAGEAGSPRFPSRLTIVPAAGAGVLPDPILAGRAFGPEDLASGANAVVISQRCAERLAPGLAPKSLLGWTLRLSDGAYRVVGVQESLPGDKTPHVVVPLESDLGRSWAQDRRQLPTLVVRLRQAERFLEVREQVVAWVRKRFGAREGELAVSNPTLRHEQIRKGMRVFKAVMGCITSLSLIVGGIGIMNVLLASVTERTREIGIRRAAGARRRDILLQFLAESCAISGLGGLLGILVGWVASLGGMVVVRILTDTPVRTVMAPGSMLLAFGAAFTVGLTFGLVPALRAARLSPTDAIWVE